MLGVLLIDKPEGVTSHDVVQAARRKLNTKRVGHSGTLDPLATGLLVLAVGPATRFLQYLPLEPKVYRASVRFGIETTTQDAEGNVVVERPLPQDLRASLEACLKSFIGPIEQIPPMYSAVKVQGKPLYAYARSGKLLERTSRKVHVERADIDSLSTDTAVLHIECSGGTYVRTIAHDLGKAMGCGAHLSGLRRERVGKFTLQDAVSIDAIDPAKLISLADALPPMPLVQLTAADSLAIREGRRIPTSHPSDGLVALLAPSGEAMGVGRVFGTQIQPECVLPTGIGDVCS